MTTFENALENSWAKMSPFWPLKNLIAVNPLQGFEDLPFEKALAEGHTFFQQQELPAAIKAINRQTIKWCQAFFDEGQATISMPGREKGLYNAWRTLALHDAQLHNNDADNLKLLRELPNTAAEACTQLLAKLKVKPAKQELFLTLMLTTLPGWAAHIKYRTHWAPKNEHTHTPVTGADYMALRLAITCLLWPMANELTSWFEALPESNVQSMLEAVRHAEEEFHTPLLKALADTTPSAPTQRPKAQMVFCIDVRSEPFRRALEQQGHYETLGFAGFFGLALQLVNQQTGESYASCPVLLSPSHSVDVCTHQGNEAQNAGSSFYKALKYSFVSPFALVETIGSWTGLWAAMRTFFPNMATKLKTWLSNTSAQHAPDVDLKNIPVEDQCKMAEGALRLMGLTQNFAPIVVFCGHGSTTQNNGYATALDCGACGGRHGGANAQVLADMLNTPEVRAYLKTVGIDIPADTHFMGGQHNTTTDEVTLYDQHVTDSHQNKVATLKQALEYARTENNEARLKDMENDRQQPLTRSHDWAQVRPEWGLARNGAFIVGPRGLTKTHNLHGRCFLHSYDWEKDTDGAHLTVILTAPMVVAQWINTQYLFSTLDNVAYGGGSKVTKNIVGKHGIMQGNASDLMHGLALQSVNQTDETPFHKPARLMTVVYAPKERIKQIVDMQPVLQKLLGNGWVQLACIDPTDQKAYRLTTALDWAKPELK